MPTMLILCQFTLLPNANHADFVPFHTLHVDVDDALSALWYPPKCVCHQAT